MSTVVPVNLGDRSYDIHVGAGLLAELGTLMKPVLTRDFAVIVTDENVASRHLETARAALAEAVATPAEAEALAPVVEKLIAAGGDETSLKQVLGIEADGTDGGDGEFRGLLAVAGMGHDARHRRQAA